MSARLGLELGYKMGFGKGLDFGLGLGIGLISCLQEELETLVVLGGLGLQGRGDLRKLTKEKTGLQNKLYPTSCPSPEPILGPHRSPCQTRTQDTPSCNRHLPCALT